MTDDNYPMNDVQLCGAKTRAGTPCKLPAMPNGRCRLHGGRSLRGRSHGRYKHGLFTQEAIEQRRQLRELLRTAEQLLKGKLPDEV